MKFLGRIITSVPFAVAVLLTPESDASTSSVSINVSATVSDMCEVSSSPLAFGSYSGGVLDQEANISVSCTNGTPYTIAVDNGTGAGATAAKREMTGPNNQTLAYGLYTDAAHSVNWSSNASTNEVSGTGAGTAQTISAYGEIPAAQSPAPGTYTDTITVTLTY